MKTTVSKSDFRDAFVNMDRGDQFSYEALGAIYDHLCEFEDGCGTELELDPIAVCCEFTEYKDLEELNDNYSQEYETLEEVENNTIVIPLTGDAFVIVDY